MTIKTLTQIADEYWPDNDLWRALNYLAQAHPSLTCVHIVDGVGLCEACESDYLDDPTAWIDYGSHAAGIAAWEALQAEMLDDTDSISVSTGRNDDLPF